MSVRWICSTASSKPAAQTSFGVSLPAIGSRAAHDFTYVSTWSGFVYVAFVIDVYVPPAEYEANYYANLDKCPVAAQLTNNSLRQTRGGSGRFKVPFNNKHM